MRAFSALIAAMFLCSCGSVSTMPPQPEPALEHQMAVVTDAPMVDEINKMHTCGGQLTYVVPHFFTFSGYSSAFTCYKMVGAYRIAERTQ